MELEETLGVGRNSWSWEKLLELEETLGLGVGRNSCSWKKLLELEETLVVGCKYGVYAGGLFEIMEAILRPSIIQKNSLDTDYWST